MSGSMLFIVTACPTTRKCRYIDMDYFRKLFEVYYMEDSPISGGLEADFLRLIDREVPDADVVIVTDFGHGLVTPAARNHLLEKSRFIAVNAQSNSANMGFNLITKYPRADYICIDAPEARLAVADKYGEMVQVINDQLATRVDCNRIIVTHGKRGCITYDGCDEIRRVPAFTDRALDTMGAGDAFLAVTSPLVATGAPMDLIGFIGNAVGAIKVGNRRPSPFGRKNSLAEIFKHLVEVRGRRMDDLSGQINPISIFWDGSAEKLLRRTRRVQDWRQLRP